MIRIDPVLAPALEDRMGRHEAAAVEDADRIGELVHLDDAPGPTRGEITKAVAFLGNEPLVFSRWAPSWARLLASLRHLAG